MHCLQFITLAATDADSLISCSINSTLHLLNISLSILLKVLTSHPAAVVLHLNNLFAWLPAGPQTLIYHTFP